MPGRLDLRLRPLRVTLGRKSPAAGSLRAPLSGGRLRRARPLRPRQAE